MTTHAPQPTWGIAHSAFMPLRNDPLRLLLARNEKAYIQGHLGAAVINIRMALMIGLLSPLAPLIILSNDAFVLDWMTGAHFLVGLVGFLAMAGGLFAPVWALLRIVRELYVYWYFQDYRNELMGFLARYNRTV